MPSSFIRSSISSFIISKSKDVGSTPQTNSHQLAFNMPWWVRLWVLQPFRYYYYFDYHPIFYASISGTSTTLRGYEPKCFDRRQAFLYRRFRNLRRMGIVPSASCDNMKQFLHYYPPINYLRTTVASSAQRVAPRV
jgi:hypothetical protein